MADNNKKPLKQPYYRLLTRNMILIIMIVTLTPGVLVMGIILRQLSDVYSEKVFSHLQELVSKHKQNINSFLNEKRADIQLIASHVDFETRITPPQLKVLLPATPLSGFFHFLGAPRPSTLK